MGADEFKRRLVQALSSKSVVIALEQDSFSSGVVRGELAILDACHSLGRPLYQWHSSEVSERSILRTFAQFDLSIPTNMSLYRAICEVMESQERGVFCISQIESMTRDGVQLVSRLIAFVKERKLPWRFILVGDFEAMSRITLGVLHIDERFELLPDQAEARSTPRVSKSFIRVLLILILAVLIGLLFWFDLFPSGTTALSAPPGEKQHVLNLEDVDKSQIKIKENEPADLALAAPAPNQDAGLALIKAVQVGDAQKVQSLLDNGANPNSTDQHNQTPLHYAVLGNHLKLVRILLIVGADPNSVSEVGKSPLLICARNGNLQIMMALLDAGAEIDWVDGLGWSALFYAAWYNHVDLATLLLERGANRELRDHDGYGAAQIAKIRNSKEVQILLR